MSKTAIKKILDHPDREEFISKLVIGISPKDVYEWLKSKYTSIGEAKFVISEKAIKGFKDNYLDIYNMIQQDIVNTKSAVETSTQDQLQLAVKNNSAYKDAMLKLAEGELDIEKMMGSLMINMETRLSQIFDQIQEDPRNINTKVDRLASDYAELLGGLMDKYYKWKEAPINQTVQHNVTLQVVDQHILVFHDVIKEILSQMDLESSLLFMEIFNTKMAALKMPEKHGNTPTQEMKMAEVKLLNETINKKVNES